MANNLSYHINEFSNKVRTMNQANSKSLTLSAEDARLLHFELFTLLAKNVELNSELSSVKAKELEITLDLNGGTFPSKT